MGNLVNTLGIYTFHLQKREVKKAFEEKGKGVLAQSNMSSCLLHYVLLLCILYFLRLSKKKLLSVGLSVSTSVSMYSVHVCLISLQSYPKIYLPRKLFGSTVRQSVYFSAVFCLSGPLIQPQARSSPQKNLLFSIILGKPKKNPPLKARPLRPYPPPLELNGHRKNFPIFLKIL